MPLENWNNSGASVGLAEPLEEGLDFAGQDWARHKKDQDPMAWVAAAELPLWDCRCWLRRVPGHVCRTTGVQTRAHSGAFSLEL